MILLFLGKGTVRRAHGAGYQSFQNHAVTGFILTNFGNMSTFKLAEIKAFFLKYETKIVLIVGFCLVSAVSFEFGVLQGQKWQQKPLIIEKPINAQGGQETQPAANFEASNTSPQSVSEPKSQQLEALAGQAKSYSSCAFVGSKNSDKFYLPTCSYAKRVKPENLACFKTAQEALGQGRTESKCK